MKAAVSIVICLLAVACGGGADEVPEADLFTPDASPDDLLPDFSTAPATVRLLELTYPSGTTSARAEAWFFASQPDFYTEVDAEGNCRLLAYTPCLCAPACDWDELCGNGGVCQRWPEPMSAGRITLGGLRTGVTMRPSNGYYQTEPSLLPEDLFDADATISASAPGDTFPAFSLQTRGVKPLSFSAPHGTSDELHLQDGADTVVSWSGRDNGARMRLWLPTPNQAHGLPSNFVIECEGLDTGSFVIAQHLVEALPPLVRSEICVGHDCPLSTLERYRFSSDQSGPGELRVSAISQTNFFLSHGE